MATNNSEFMKQRDKVIPELVALEKKHGQDVVLAAMRKRVAFVKEETKRLKGIAKLENELKELRDKVGREKKALKR